jgi:hypothetical protein
LIPDFEIGFLSLTKIEVFCPKASFLFVVSLKRQKLNSQTIQKSMNTTNSSSEYLLLARGNDWDRSLSPAELQKVMSSFLAWFERLSTEGILKKGQPLMEETRIVSGKNGRTVADGPFAESKEAIGGYFLIKADSLDDAVAIAQQCPMLEFGVVMEVRPIAADCPSLHRARKALGEELVASGV